MCLVGHVSQSRSLRLLAECLYVSPVLSNSRLFLGETETTDQTVQENTDKAVHVVEFHVLNPGSQLLTA